jgi:hypothetical protein
MTRKHRREQELSVYEVLWSMYEADPPWAPIATDFVLIMEDFSDSITDIARMTCGNMLSGIDLWEHRFGPAAMTAVVLLEIMSPPEMAGVYRASLLRAGISVEVEAADKIPDPRPIVRAE